MELRNKLVGLKDPRGMQGMLSRGTNIYPGGSKAAQKGPMKKTAQMMAKSILGKKV